MTLIVKSLDAVAALGPGGALMFDIPRSPIGMGVTFAGATSVFVNLEGTFDGVNWINLGTVFSTTGLVTSSNVPVIGIRANLTEIDGGTSPSVTAWVSAKP
jgi:hypothetical protein